MKRTILVTGTWRLVLSCLSAILAISVGTTAFAQKTSGTQHWKSHKVLQSLVLIEAIDHSDSSWQPFGAGVFVDIDTTWPSVFVITNKHIYMGRDSLRYVFRRYWREDSLSMYNEIPQVIRKNVGAYIPTTDDSDFVAVVITRPSDDTHLQPVAAERIVSFDDLEYGEAVVFYGYPNYESYGLYRGQFDMPIARSGSIAYFSHHDVWFGGKRVMIPSMFLIDGVSMGGNSGGPVFIRRPYINKNSIIVYDTRLAGIIRGHYPAVRNVTIDLSGVKAISKLLESQTPSTDSLFLTQLLSGCQVAIEENSNLAYVISMDIVIEFVRRVVLEDSAISPGR